MRIQYFENEVDIANAYAKYFESAIIVKVNHLHIILQLKDNTISRLS